MKFFDLRASKKALKEITYNYDKLLNVYEKEKFSVMFENNKAEVYENFYLVNLNFIFFINFFVIFTKFFKKIFITNITKIFILTLLIEH